MVLASWGFKVKGQNKTSKTQKEDGAKDESDSERQKIGTGMCPHERDKVEGSHFHKATREDADDAKEVHSHGEARREDGVEQKEPGVGEHKEKFERFGDAAGH